jgi:hypothetical protein
MLLQLILFRATITCAVAATPATTDFCFLILEELFMEKISKNDDE